MRIVVFGGRNYSDWVAFCRAMEPYRGYGEALTIISGHATGADQMGEQWGLIYRAKVLTFPADWRPGGIFDRMAGFRRNQQMIDEGKPDRAMECPGGNGTADMHRRLVRAGIPIEYVVKSVASLFD